MNSNPLSQSKRKPLVWIRTLIAAVVPLLALSCANQGIQKDIRRAELFKDYAGAHSKLTNALAARPNDPTLLKERSRIEALYYGDLIKEESSIPTNNLAERIEVLEKAATLNVSNKTEVVSLLTILKVNRTQLLIQANNLTNATDAPAAISSAEAILHFSTNDEELQLALRNPSIATHIDQLLANLASLRDFKKARELGERSIRLWPSAAVLTEVDPDLQTTGGRK